MTLSSWYAGNETTIITFGITFLLAMSMQVTMRVGVLSLAGLGFYAVGSYATGIVVLRDIIPAPVAILASIVVCGLLSLAFGLALHRVRGLYLAMVTLGFVLILGVIAANGGTLTGGANGMYGVPITISAPEVVLASLVVIAAACLWERGRAGRATNALRTDQLLSTSVGIDARRMRNISFLLSGAIGGLAGSLNVLSFGAVSPSDAGFAMLTTMITVVIVGGQRSWAGVLLGAILISWLPTWLVWFEGATREIILGLLIVVLGMFAPDGLLGVFSWLFGRLRGIRRRSVPPPVAEPPPARQLEESSRVR
ncbi:branched-chain amino acid ABC transporter permease [Pseudonocardia ailaonensis]|uniref:Branched-chain amino acid ABC transporter permease n=1 Tax=Pseudonocardia ailaonensis TaxID=367279 RepID=A0ABN2NK00_9PSEU